MLICVFCLLAFASVPVCIVFCLQSIVWDAMQNDILMNVGIIATKFLVIHSHKIVSIIKLTFKVF